MRKYVKLQFEDNFIDEERKVMDRLIDLQQSILSKDTKHLKHLFTNNFILVRGTGRKETRREFIKDIKADILHYTGSKIYKPTILIVDDEALIETKVRISTELAGVESIWDLKSEFQLEKIEDEWYFKRWDTS